METGRYKRLLAFLVEGAFGLLLVLLPIRWMDKTGKFEIIEEDHVRERWVSLEAMNGKFPVDVLILGNSHAYTGIDPEWLSAATGMTCFVLANLGVNAVDNYWALKEALELTQPQIVLIETTGMNDRPTISDTKTGLVNQLRAFHARTNTSLKVQSSLELFELDDLPTAWSKTIMNHHLWWTDPQMFLKNIERGQPYRPRLNQLYLGGHIRFFSGLEDSTMTIYRERGGILDGAEKYVCEESQNAARGILDLAQEHGFQVGFVTLPMFEDFIANPEVREQYLRDFIEPTGAPWINLQTDTTLTRNPLLFENTLGENQHLTMRGALEVNQPIADWIEASFSDLKRPGRENKPLWHKILQTQRGYFAYFDPVVKENPTVKFIQREVPINNQVLPWVVAFQPEDANPNFITVHARPPQSWFTNFTPQQLNVQLTFKVKLKNGEETEQQALLTWEDAVNDGKRWLFRGAIETCEIQQLVYARFVPRTAARR